MKIPVVFLNSWLESIDYGMILSSLSKHDRLESRGISERDSCQTSCQDKNLCLTFMLSILWKHTLRILTEVSLKNCGN